MAPGHGAPYGFSQGAGRGTVASGHRDRREGIDMDRERKTMIRTLVEWALAATWITLLIIACVRIGNSVDRLNRLVDAHETPSAVVRVDLPSCDDDAPGRPITGTCWLADDDQVAVWPYPYAPEPIYVLTGAGAR